MAVAIVAGSGALRGQSTDDLRRAYDSQPPEQVERLLQTSLGVSPDDPRILLFAAEFRADRGRLAEAEAFARRALTLAMPPDSAGHAHVLLSGTRFRLGDARGSRARLDSARAAGAHAAALAGWYGRLTGVDGPTSSWPVSQSDHVRLHVQPGADVKAARFLAAREADLERMQTLFGVPLPKKIDIFVWRSSDDARRLGFPPLPLDDPLLSLVHVVAGGDGGHELAHILAYWAAIPWRPARLIREGTAEHFGSPSIAGPAPARAILREPGGPAVSIARLWSDDGRAPEALVRAVGAVLVERLLRSGGRDRFLALLEDQSLENARRLYGDALDGEIEALERDLQAQ